MPSVYAKTLKSIRFFCAAATLSLLTGCTVAGTVSGVVSGRTPWDLPVNTGVVTRNPDSLPNIAWQTPGQRETLNTQGDAFARAQTEAAKAETPPPTSRRKIVVSLLLPLSGKGGDLGQSMLKAAQMALFDVGATNVELKPRDTRGGAAEAARLALQDGSELILGPLFTDDLKAAKPVLAHGKAPVVSFSTDWSQADDQTYIMGFLPFAQVARVAEYAQSKGYPRIAVLAPKTEYCNVVVTTLQRTASKVGPIQRYAAQEPDLTGIVSEFMDQAKDASGAPAFDALLLPVGGEGLQTLAGKLDAQGLNARKVKLLGTGLWDDTSTGRGDALHGGWYAAPDPRLRADFEKRYAQTYGAAPLRLASLAYDATALAAVLARSAGADTPFTRENMTNPRGFAGIDGIFRFRADGLAERGLAILEVQSGRARLIDPAPTAFLAPGG